MLKPLVSLAAFLVAAAPALAAPDFAVLSFTGPETLQAGVSGTYELVVNNGGDEAAPMELIIIYQGELDQTDRIIAPSFDCERRDADGITAAVYCVIADFEPGAVETIIVQGRGYEPGRGRISPVLNPNGFVDEESRGNNNADIRVDIE